MLDYGNGSVHGCVPGEPRGLRPAFLLALRAVNAEQPDLDDMAGCFHSYGESASEPVTSTQKWNTVDEVCIIPSLCGHLLPRAQPAVICNAKHASPRKPLNSKRMTKQQLIEKVAAKTELKKSEVEVAVDSVLAMIAEALQANERVDLRGFGSFVVKDRKERQGRNPRTGETITIAAKRDASFKPGKELTEKLAHGETAPTPEVAP